MSTFTINIPTVVLHVIDYTPLLVSPDLVQEIIRKVAHVMELDSRPRVTRISARHKYTSL
jgi:hypothetical protein